MLKYTSPKYFQKSLLFLYPLLGIKTKPLNSYLYWDVEGVDENIIDYFLIVEYPKGTEVDSTYLHSVYYTNDSEIYIFDIQHKKEDVDHFLNGEYSKFTQKSKEIILKYTEWISGNKIMSVDYVKKANNLKPHYHVAFYPLDFKEEVAEEWVERDIFDNKYEALRVLKDMTELWPVFDLEKETLKKEIHEK